MASSMQNYGSKPDISASANICPTACNIGGIFVSSVTGSPTITIYDSATTTTTKKVVSSFVPIAGIMYPFPLAMTDGIYIVITGTIVCNVLFA